MDRADSHTLYMLLLFFCDTGDMVKYVPEGEITCDTFKTFSADFFEGKLTPHFNTEEIPDDWDAKPVKVRLHIKSFSLLCFW